MRAGGVRSGVWKEIVVNQSAGQTRLLIICGAVAGPVYAVVSLLQAFTRAGFDLTRNQLSQLSTGDLGWIQVANFLISGSLFTLGAVGMSRAMRSGPAASWGPRLLGVFGAGLVVAGLFRPDPGFGFPPGTPAGPPTAFTGSAGAHLGAASVAFLCLIAFCIVFSRRFARDGRPALAGASIVIGLLLFVATAANGAAPGQASTTVGFTVVALLGFIWASVTAVSLLSERFEARSPLMTPAK
jgi:hypothetical protein